MKECAFNACHLKGATLKAPPFSRETIIMRVTGWDYLTLMNTPNDIVEEVMLIESTRAEYQAQKASD